MDSPFLEIQMDLTQALSLCLTAEGRTGKGD